MIGISVSQLNMCFRLTIFPPRVSPFALLAVWIVVFIISQASETRAQEKTQRGKTRSSYAITYNPDGSATIVAQIRWKKTEGQGNVSCTFTEEKETQEFRLVTRIINNGRDN